MQIKVAVVGHYGVPFAQLVTLTTEHPLCVYGYPVVIVNERPNLPVDAALEGWYILPTGLDGEELVKSWQSAVAKYMHFQRDRALQLGPAPANRATGGSSVGSKR